MHALLDAISRLERPTDAQRVFHGRGGLHPGSEQWSLDAYAPVWLLTSHQPVSDSDLDAVLEALRGRWSVLAPSEPLNCVFQLRQEARSETRVLSGDVPDPHTVSEGPVRFRVHLPRGLNHGLFLDMAAGRQWVRDRMQAQPGARVLNLFAYTCAFSVVAMQAGASQVVNVDMAGSALNIGKQNHALNGLGQGASFLPHDIFSSWGKLRRSGPHDLVIVDPPAYQKGSFVAEKDYVRLMRRLPDLLAPGGHAMLCLNSTKLETSFLLDLMQEAAPSLRFVERLANPRAFDDASPERALKVLIFQAPTEEPGGDEARPGHMP
ncbi:class I SAM-dependent methyltransferase [Aquabacterium parvum]|jgi:23S rRNA (cytosine1962-C5)-methyltransferase|uniref:class I SAM-dependent methyltransferase n=1 Tax=Aquabacterium parvum TaxID=70584 RepID=UPI000718D8C9|nr:class I SAM-dependent methyltransferase [Aquabacterium parvum]